MCNYLTSKKIACLLACLLAYKIQVFFQNFSRFILGKNKKILLFEEKYSYFSLWYWGRNVNCSVGSRPRLHVCRHYVAGECDGKPRSGERFVESTGENENQRKFEQSNGFGRSRIVFVSVGSRPRLYVCRHYVAGESDRKATEWRKIRSRGCKSTGKSENSRTNGNPRTFD